MNGGCMEVKVLLNEKNVLELELVGSDQSLSQLISERLNQDKDVEFASFKVEHPLLGSPKLYVRTKKGDASKLVLEKIEEIKNELADFRKQFNEISK
jgi:DNA-directed RNA polymerase subunit L